MLRSLEITNFRGLPSLTAHGLGRVNLLVGKNNSGKTSVLEAIELLRGGAAVFWQSAHRRGDLVAVEREISPRFAWTATCAWYFPKADIHIGARFIVKGSANDGSPYFEVKIDNESDGVSTIAVVSSTVKDGVFELGSQAQNLKSTSYVCGRMPAAVFLGPSPGWEHSTVQGLSKLLLQPEEQMVLDAIRIVEPDIERVGIASDADQLIGKSSVVARLRGHERRMPLSAMGDGMWRLLALAVGLANAANGTLLVDEIDGGLHHTAMADMWRLVRETAARLNVQVFATTHSEDCVRALAEIAHDPEVALHRVERGQPTTVAYRGEEIIYAAKHGVEVR